jgi:tetratricopeptide (TPR) repeat protein
MRALSCVLFGAICLAAAPPRACAQPAAPTASAKAAAKQYVADGLAAHERGDYDAAIALYQKAYDLVPHPALIFNQAQAHRLAGRLAQARSLYASYLAQVSTGDQATTAREWIADIDARTPPAAPQVTPPAAGAVVAPPAPGPAVAPPAESPEKRGATLRLTGIGTAALGGVAVAIGIGYAVHGNTLSNEVEKQYDPSKVAAGERANTRATLDLIAGGLLIGGGAALYFWGYQLDRRHEAIALRPMVSGQLVGLAVSGSM